MAVNPAVGRGIVAHACARPGTPGPRAGCGFSAVISAFPVAGGPWTC
jgi:hypothetical protein